MVRKESCFFFLLVLHKHNAETTTKDETQEVSEKSEDCSVS